MSNDGWIKLHRCLLDKAAWKLCNEGQKVVLITILMLANREPKRWLWNGEPYECQAGQLITSLPSLADESGVSVQTVRSAITKLEKLGFLTSESGKNGRLITITNWSTYQGANGKNPTGNQQTSQQDANSQPNRQPTGQKPSNCNDSEGSQNATQQATNRQVNRQSTVNPTDSQQTANRQPTDSQQLTRNKELRSREEENKESYIPPTPLTGLGKIMTITETDVETLGVEPALSKPVASWIRNRAAKGQALTEEELKSLVSKVKDSTVKYGAKAVSDLIEENMASGYKGITWNKLEQRTRDAPQKSVAQRIMEIPI